jgi:gamma-glutamyltranspeptidase/glutathione hydrolase
MDGLWISRRSPVISTKGVCASSQSLATAIGLRILREGGNAADAAVAMAAALNVTEPCSTGIGGDAFSLYYDASTKRVSCLQGNGASSENFTLDLLNERGYGILGEGLKPLDPRSGLCCTVPGAAALWENMIKENGKLSLAQVLQPAIELADDGFAIGPVTADQWSTSTLQGEEAFRVLRPDNKRIVPGQLFRNPDLAETFRTLAAAGAAEGFYRGRIADAIVRACADFGGVLSHADLEAHTTARADPISIVYHGLRIFQTPPPSQGLAVLLSLQYIQAYERMHGGKLVDIATSSSPSHADNNQSVPLWQQKFNIDELHITLECMRRAYCDGLQYIGDPRSLSSDHALLLEELLSDAFAESRVRDIHGSQTTEVLPGTIPASFTEGETVYFCVVDNDGNACSFINSNYMGFGSGIMPLNTGFTLQNRGHNFSLARGHPNQAGPRKRPYHTIIPGMATYAQPGGGGEEEFCAAFGNMGGFMQPMGHVQLLRNIVDYKLDVQAACEAPRWYLLHTGETQDAQDCRRSVITFEEQFGRCRLPAAPDSVHSSTQSPWVELDLYQEIVEGLRAKGHVIEATAPRRGEKRTMYGRAQVIWKDQGRPVFWAGSDPRADGCAMPFF